MLDLLPPEVATRILEHARKPDLYSILQVFTRCHQLAAAVLYRQISLSLDDMQPAVTRWTELLDRTKLWEAPRCITVANSYDVPPPDTSSSGTPSSPGTPSEPVSESAVSELALPELAVPEEFAVAEFAPRELAWNELGKVPTPKLVIPSVELEDPIGSGLSDLHTRTRCMAIPCQTDSEAAPLVAFLRKLSSLGTLIWYSSAAPAPSLSLLLQNELPWCKLHLRAFSVPYSPDLEHMQSLVTLPNLRGIWFQHTHQNKLQDLLQRVVKHQKSSLEEVRMLHGFVGATPVRDASPVEWNDPEGCEGLGEDRLGRLTSLHLAGYDRDLRSWIRCTDFSVLRHLSVHGGDVTPVSGLEILLTLQLSSLDSLALALGRSDAEYSTAFQALMCSIRPLSRLRLAGGCEIPQLKAILEYHGEALRSLYLVPYGRSSCFTFTSSTIALITESCKDITELGITMQRHWNKPGEDAAIFDAIGQLHYLSDLHITFDASDPCMRPWGDMEEYLQVDDGEGHIRDAMINSAIDGNLAKAVFDMVASSAESNAGLSDASGPFCMKKTSRLRCMSLAAKDGGLFGSGQDSRLNPVPRELEKKWWVERHLPDADLEAWREEPDHGFVPKPPKYITPNVEAVFRGIWPAKGGRWFDEWHAFLPQAKETEDPGNVVVD